MNFSGLGGLLRSVRYPYVNRESISLFYGESPERNHLLLWCATKLTGKVDYLMPADQEKALCDAVNVIATLKVFNDETKPKFIKGTMKKSEQILIWKEVIEVIRYLHRFDLDDSVLSDDNDQSEESTEKMFLGENNNNGGCVVESSISPNPGYISNKQNSPEKEDIGTFNFTKLRHEAQMIWFKSLINSLNELNDQLKECNKFIKKSSLVLLTNSKLLRDISEGYPAFLEEVTAEVEPHLDDLKECGNHLSAVNQSFADLRKVLLK